MKVKNLIYPLLMFAFVSLSSCSSSAKVSGSSSIEQEDVASDEASAERKKRKPKRAMNRSGVKDMPAQMTKKDKKNSKHL